MSIRKRKPFELGRYLGTISTQRIQKLEEIKQQLLELDNRLKMEMVGLRELTGRSVDISDEVTGFPNFLRSFSSKTVCYFILFHAYLIFTLPLAFFFVETRCYLRRRAYTITHF